MSEKHSPLLELADCPFCGSPIKHVTSLAQSFDPPRLYHEWHHVESSVDCPIRRHGQIVASASDDESEQQCVIRGWNTRMVSALPELVAALEEIRKVADETPAAEWQLDKILDITDAALSKVKG